MDLLGHFLRITPGFRGKRRLLRLWMQRERAGDRRQRRLAGGTGIFCDLSVPYEAMVWLQQEEEADLAALRRLLKPGQTFVDCGANIGLWTLTAAAAVGGGGHVFAFEPNPPTYEKLLKNLKANHFETIVQPHCLACGEKSGSLPFVSATEHNNSRIVAGADAKPVTVTTLRDAIGDAPVHGIKVDVEGFELQVLRGAENILRRSKPWLCVEFNTLLAGSKRLGDWEVHRYLEGLGYGCTEMAGSPELPDAKFLSGDWETPFYCNLFYRLP